MESRTLRAWLSCWSTSALLRLVPAAASPGAGCGRLGGELCAAGVAEVITVRHWRNGRGSESRTNSGSCSSVGMLLLVRSDPDAFPADRLASLSRRCPGSEGSSGGKSVTEKTCAAATAPARAGAPSTALSSVSTMPSFIPSTVPGSLGRAPEAVLMRLLRSTGSQ